MGKARPQIRPHVREKSLRSLVSSSINQKFGYLLVYTLPLKRSPTSSSLWVAQLDLAEDADHNGIHWVWDTMRDNGACKSCVFVSCKHLRLLPNSCDPAHRIRSEHAELVRHGFDLVLNHGFECLLLRSDPKTKYFQLKITTCMYLTIKQEPLHNIQTSRKIGNITKISNILFLPMEVRQYIRKSAHCLLSVYTD